MIVPEAEEFIIRNCVETLEIAGVNQGYIMEELKKAFIGFAKIHCEAQAEEILINIEIDDFDEHQQYSPSINEESIKKAYPLTNIK